ncbi:MAG TPA: histidine phosphatase family protein, partial [Acetobacteraceae bacterium]|nr:histidine phosphatase family protein [Acetobacteraceae bacterium]
VADRDRPLNARGRRDAAALRTVMRDGGLTPDLVLASPSARTLETLEALEPWDDMPLTESVEALYLAGAAQILGVLQGVAETVRSVLLIGHNPGLHELAARLAAGGGDAAQRLAAKFPTAALAEFAVSGPWRELQPGTAHLTRFAIPAELRDRNG